MSPLTGSRARWLVASVLLLAASSVASARPVQAPIVIDGDFVDWAQVLTNAANTTRDGDGSSIACGSSVDRDCSVFTPDVDLARFARWAKRPPC